MVGRQVLCLRLKSRVEKPYHEVGMLLFLDDFHPLFGRSFQLFKTQSRAQSVGHPCDDVGCQQSEYGGFVAIAFQYCIRSEIRLPCRFINDIGG